MSRTLSIPVRQTITLPDNWQACRTPQELSYWLISQFDEFEHEVGTLAADVAALQSDLASLTTDVGNIDVRLVTIESQMSSVIASLGTINEQINDQTTGILARLTLLEQSYSGLSYDVASLDNTVNAPTTGLAARVAAIETDLTSIHDALISQGTDILTLQTDTAALKTTVGDSTSGLVKKTNTLEAKIDGPNGLDDRVTALEQGGGGKVYQHIVILNPTPSGRTCQILFYSTQSTQYTFAQIRDKVLLNTQYYLCNCTGGSTGSHDGTMSAVMLFKNNNTISGLMLTIRKDEGANTCKMYNDSLTLSSLGAYIITEM